MAGGGSAAGKDRQKQNIGKKIFVFIRRMVELYGGSGASSKPFLGREWARMGANGLNDYTDQQTRTVLPLPQARCPGRRRAARFRSGGADHLWPARTGLSR